MAMSAKTKAKRQRLATLSRAVKSLVAAGAYDSVNQALVEMYKEETGAEEFNTFWGWVHSGKNAAEEMNEPEAAQYFKTNFTLLKSPFIAIENKIEEVKEVPEVPDIKKESVDLKKISNFNSEQISLFRKLYKKAV